MAENQRGQLMDYKDTKMLDMYLKRYAGTEVGRRVISPDLLMQYIDGASRRVWDSRTPDNGYDIKMAKEALANIYGINAYTPKGFVDQNTPID